MCGVCGTCLCDGRRGNETPPTGGGHGANGDQSAINHRSWEQRVVYADKRRPVRGTTMPGPDGVERKRTPKATKKKKKRSSTNERRRPCPSGCRKSCLGPPVNWFHRSPTNYHTCPSTRSCHLSRKSPQKIPFNHLQLQAHQKSAPYAPLLQNTLALAALLAHVLSTALKFIRAVIHAQAFAIPRNLCR